MAMRTARGRTVVKRGRAWAWLLPGLLLVLTVAALGFGPVGPVAAADADSVAFGPPTAEGALGEPLVFTVDITTPVVPDRVELLSRLPQDPTAFVRVAGLSGDADRWTASVVDGAHLPPNTTLVYRFRAVLPDGSTALSEEASHTITDPRFAWRSRTDGGVTLHWYEGDDGFADRALGIGSRAIARAAELLGVTDMPPVDFFVYADEEPFYDALGPGTRENVGGQANAEIRTMFGLIRPSEIGSDWVDTLVAHELTHLVFAEAVDNPYHHPPRWLNEGLAVHLTQGFDTGDRAAVSDAVRRGRIIPLEGLAGLFPTQRDRFSLAYAESAAAVDFLIRTHGEAALAALITSYATGVTDDEAFRAALGMDLRAFDDAWLASIGVTRPEPFGPRPAPPGPVPAGWTSPPPA